MKIVLTFDIERDIPGVFNSYLGVNNGLLRILEILEKYNVKGTFFCTGDIAEHLPNCVKLIEKKGHEIACHGLNHERLNLLSYNACYQLISQSKILLENLCQHTEVIGFRAPFLKPPSFLFKVLGDLGFKYDSSISSPKNLKNYQNSSLDLYEFYPINYGLIFRSPFNIKLSVKKLFNKDLGVLYFHAWEAIDMKSLILRYNQLYTRYRNLFFRPDRWFNTGAKFLSKLNLFVEKALSDNVKFVALKELINN
ncbi:MAG: polysaccharide deacetylase family protein [Candidatus Hermodarchaeota archaeon]